MAYSKTPDKSGKTYLRVVLEDAVAYAGTPNNGHNFIAHNSLTPILNKLYMQHQGAVMGYWDLNSVIFLDDGSARIMVSRLNIDDADDDSVGTWSLEHFLIPKEVIDAADIDRAIRVLNLRKSVKAMRARYEAVLSSALELRTSLEYAELQLMQEESALSK